MKNNGILIVAVLVVVAIAAYFLLKGKSTGSDATVTQTKESTTGVAALFNTGAMTSLFGRPKSTDTKPTDVKDVKTEQEQNLQTSLGIISMLGGW